MHDLTAKITQSGNTTGPTHPGRWAAQVPGDGVCLLNARRGTDGLEWVWEDMPNEPAEDAWTDGWPIVEVET